MSLDYNTCKKLREARFPFDFTGDYCVYGCECNMVRSKNGHVVNCPTLEELIEACGDKMLHLRHDYDGKWSATYPHETIRKLIEGQGSTPSEAVANLWLALHEK